MASNFKISGFKFDNTTDPFVVEADGYGVFAKQSFSISLWVRYTGLGFQESFHPWVYDNVYLTISNSRYLRFSVQNYNLDVDYPGQYFPGENNLYHIVATFTSGSQKIYVNNVEAASATNSLTITYSHRPVYVGALSVTTGSVEISYFQYFDRVLNTTEINTLYNKGTVSTPIFKLVEEPLDNLAEPFTNSIGSPAGGSTNLPNICDLGDANAFTSSSVYHFKDAGHTYTFGSTGTGPNNTTINEKFREGFYYNFYWFSDYPRKVYLNKVGSCIRNTFRFNVDSAYLTQYLIRNDSEIKRYGDNAGTPVLLSTYPASFFGLPKAPRYLAFVMAGGGGGGGGGSGTVSSGGGGGGGLAMGHVAIPTTTNPTDGVKLTIGSGGGGGAGGTGSNAQRGSTGSLSKIEIGTFYVTCNPGTGGANVSPTNGSGGTVSSYSIEDRMLYVLAQSTGGNGGTNGGGTGGTAAVSNYIIEGKQISQTGNGGTAPTSQGGGGGSYGNGGNGVTSAAGAPGDKGGGGGGGVYTVFDGKNGGNGGKGWIAFYY